PLARSLVLRRTASAIGLPCSRQRDHRRARGSLRSSSPGTPAEVCACATESVVRPRRPAVAAWFRIHTPTAECSSYPRRCERVDAPAPVTSLQRRWNMSLTHDSQSRGHRVRELVCSYRTLRDDQGQSVRVTTLALTEPRTAAAALAPLLAGEPV